MNLIRIKRNSVFITRQRNVIKPCLACKNIRELDEVYPLVLTSNLISKVSESFFNTSKVFWIWIGFSLPLPSLFWPKPSAISESTKDVELKLFSLQSTDEASKDRRRHAKIFTLPSGFKRKFDVYFILWNQILLFIVSSIFKKI